MKLQFKEFFGASGLTATSANYVANMAKEFYRKLESEVNNFHAFNVDVKIIGSDEVMRTVNGTTSEEFALIPEKLRKIAECKALIAYLREAIKERENIYKNIQKYEDTDARKGLECPQKAVKLTADDVLATWNIGQLNKFYELEAKCATLGKYIHEGGTFNSRRQSYHETLQKPITVSGKGRDLLAEECKPTLSSKEIDDMFFKLQDEYRSAQAEFNGMKHTIDEVIEQDAIQKLNEYKKAYSEFETKLEKITIAEEQYRDAALKEVQKLKIVIPSHLQSIYSEISNLSK